MPSNIHRLGGTTTRAFTVAACAALFVVATPALAQDDGARAALCDLGPGTAERFADNDLFGRQNDARDNALNAFAVDCLGLKLRAQYDTVNLNGQVQAISNASTAEVVPYYARYYRTPLEDGRVRVSTHRLRIGASVPLDKDGKSATFADLSQPNLNEVGLILGYEYGRVRIRSEEFVELARKGLGKARRDCLAEQTTTLAADPLTQKTTATRLRTPAEALAACDGANLSRWMSEDDRRNTYYTAIVQPQWRPREDPSLYVGVEGRYARATRSFFALGDPAQTGNAPITQLPADFPANPSRVKRDLFAVKVYAGSSFLVFSSDAGSVMGRPKEGAIDATIGYRRDLQFVKGTQDQTVCPNNGGAIITCSSVNTAAPYLLDGWVLGARAALAGRPTSYLRDIGIEARVTYALDIRQVGVEIPVYFLTDADGKTRAGIAFNFTDSGRTDNGFRIEGAQKISVFFGRPFRLSGRP